MRKIRALGLLASAVTLWSCVTTALAQHVTGGMGESIHIGAFGSRPEGRLTGNILPKKASEKTRRVRDAEMSAGNKRHVKPTLPGKHLR